MTSNAYILLLFVCIFFHACNARRHLISPLDKKLEKKPDHFSLKIVEKNGYDSSMKKLNEGDHNKMSIDQLIVESKKSKGSKHRRSTNQRVLKDVGKASIFGLKTKSHVSVSWHVPHKKHSEKHPGFNMDYSPPKTHPPSHN